MKVLVFTSSYNRPYMLRQCILNIKNQSYKDYIHSVNVVSDNPQTVYPLVEDLFSKKLIIDDGRVNEKIHINHLTAIRNVPNYQEYDLFVKVDDDDVYKKNYIKNIVDFFRENTHVDITSTEIIYQLNGSKLIGNINLYSDLGGNPGDSDYKMPMTFAFNRKALQLLEYFPEKNILHNNDDLLWRDIWVNNSLVHEPLDNSEEIIWHIHGKNTSTAGFLQKPKQTRLKRLLTWLGL